MKILHLVDPTTNPQALEMLGTLVAQDLLAALPDQTDHHVLVLGHRAIGQALRAAGVPAERIQYSRSLGWADPAGLLALRETVSRLQPTHVHAWGTTGLAAASAIAFTGPRLATLAAVPSPLLRRALHFFATPWTWSSASASILAELQHADLPHAPDAAFHLLTPGIDAACATGADRLQLRKTLGLNPDDYPVVLIGGTGPAARHDHALWAAAILQQVYPKTKVLLRAAPGSASNPARAFAQVLSAPDIVLFTPPDMPWPTLVQAADFFLLTPDRSLPTASLLWAMAGRLPIIATDIPTVREILDPDRTALLAPAGQPRALAARLEEVLHKPALQTTLAQNAHAQVTQRHTLDAMRDSFQALYRSASLSPATAYSTSRCNAS